MSRFQDKVAFVTGGASGIGLAVSQTLVRDGARVVIGDINIDLAKKSAAAIGSRAVAIEVDQGDAKSVESAVAFAEETFGGLDLAVNAAAIQGPLGKILEMDPKSIENVYRVNTCGITYCLVYELAALKRRGGGAIVNIASISGMRPTPGLGVYSASKTAVISLTNVAAAEYGPDNIRVNAISPGYVDTPLLDQRLDRKWIASITPSRRCGQPQDLADAICFMLSDDARQVSGTNLQVDGGLIASLSIVPPDPE
ncbi:uncharacterized protein Z519_08601 [Cladophialophora bantiana CBS 173.52]|uniref:Ketoreductase domain-containing protein n=1 Tax=Cladophialophora bantiana (strain ATCC 10958 / CBS 173.52 / CDC B-1940 / NIH 8579) TaxID=1442370 RepID=A0A0D2HBZ9_CLAB1|nr:uncharacterized protein Z519_08601 [Cladophialophora bantiana CBS 173.52]KIW90818.1 hypothetical protein Z519_08601 [Cladophialophora bantiana CBS 173.52]